MKLLREFLSVCEDHAGSVIFAAIVVALIYICTMVYILNKRQHEFRMELLKQGKVSIESIR